jgi:helicase
VSYSNVIKGATDVNGGKGRFHGLFVGVDRYQSPDINNLAAAARDAAALHALFDDNLSGSPVLLTNEAATRAVLVDQLEQLAHTTRDDDIVVIGFSGHGSDTHELVLYDTDPYDLAATGLPLDEFTDLISAIPARQLVIVLDCCFSGGAGAKVLRAPLRPRGGSGGGLLSAGALLDRLAGTGRLILTASTADQEAYEDPKLGHGVLTYHLLQALRGAEAVVEQGRLPLYNLLSYVTKSVIASVSGTYAARQEPTLRGQMDGEINWPVFQLGPRFTELFPAATAAPVTSAIDSLRAHGLTDAVLEAWAAALPGGLNELQQAAINEVGLLRRENVVVTAPTSSGKTLIGELAALQAAQTGGRSVFLLPTRALVNEQYDRFSRTYGPLGVRTIRATGEISDQVPALLRGQFDLAVLTYEKFSGLALGHPHLLRLLSVVVIDEVQTIVDPTRGPNLEFLLTLLKARRQDGIAPQVIALSAVLGDLRGLDSWLEASLLRRTERPVKLAEGVLGPDGVYRQLKPDGREEREQLIRPQYGATPGRTLIVPLVRHLVAEQQQVIVFRAVRGEARGCAEYLARSLGLPPATSVLADLPTGDPSGASEQLRRCLAGGVAFHISDLDPDEKGALEQHFRAPGSELRVLVATTTLAQGVNLPAETVIIAGLEHPAGPGQSNPYTVAEYKNIAGRAGRLGLTTQGQAVVLVSGDFDGQRKWERYITGTPEDLHSQLLGDDTDVLTLALRVVSVASARDSHLTEDDVLAFLANSFAAHQARLAGRAEAFSRPHISRAVSELVASGLVNATPGLGLTELGTMVAQSGITVRSAVRVASVLRQVPAADLRRATLIAAAQLTTELDDVYMAVNGRGWQRETQTYLGELRRHGPSEVVLTALLSGPDGKTGAARTKRAVACLLWMGGVPVGQVERLLTRHLPGNDAAGPVRAAASRTRDVIGTVIDIARYLHPTVQLDDLAGLLPVQLELGIPADLVPLALQAGANLGRHDYLRLQNAGLTEPATILGTDDEALLACVGGSRLRLDTLRQAAEAASRAADEIKFEDVLPSSAD